MQQAARFFKVDHLSVLRWNRHGGFTSRQDDLTGCCGNRPEKGTARPEGEWSGTRRLPGGDDDVLRGWSTRPAIDLPWTGPGGTNLFAR